MLDLDENEHKQVVGYSAGMRKKIGLATALLHEPFEAVEPVSARTIRAILQRFVAGGGSVILSSHVMALMEQIGDHVALNGDGRMVAAGPLDKVRAGIGLEERWALLVIRGRLVGARRSWLVTGVDQGEVNSVSG